MTNSKVSDGTVILVGLGALIAIVLFYFYTASHLTGSDVTRMQQGSCPDGYISHPTTSRAYDKNGNSVTIRGESCLPQAPR
jgi:hypothetical protein